MLLHPVEQKVKQTIEQYNLIQPGEKLLVAISGGQLSISSENFINIPKIFCSYDLI
ncbi:hypothetical protein HYS48_03500 [Candidatus Woesearchaeota archaeon]|nr:hypothetical protein [Candidatus Woesearchaeota archaeon]